MFGEKNAIRQDMGDFFNANGLIGGRYSLDAVLEYATLVETRIQNNLLCLIIRHYVHNMVSIQRIYIPN